jgi:hypothetical protein
MKCGHAVTLGCVDIHTTRDERSYLLDIPLLGSIS